MKSRLTLFAALCMLCSQIGCGDVEGDAHADEHHLEHFVPDYKPASFAESVEQIEHRCEHLAAHAGHGHHDEADEFQELVEIVDWIPELAADSDLNEADWNKAVLAGQVMAQQLATCMMADGSLDVSGLPQATAAELKTLQALISQAGRPEVAIHHDHDHDHGDHGHGDHDEHEEEQHSSESQKID